MVSSNRKHGPYAAGKSKTPLREVDLYSVPVYAKFESANLSGSHKDRVARAKIGFLR